MTEQEHEWLRTIREQTVFEQPPLLCLPGEGKGQGVVIEYYGASDWHRTGIAILVTDNQAYFYRTETFSVPTAYRYMVQNAAYPPDLLDHPRPGISWQGVISCDVDLAKSHLNYLADYGLWELNDFRPGDEFLDGDYLIVRACDHENRLAVDACLFCFAESISPYNRKLNARMHHLLELPESALTQGWLGRFWNRWK